MVLVGNYPWVRIGVDKVPRVLVPTPPPKPPDVVLVSRRAERPIRAAEQPAAHTKIEWFLTVY